VYELPPGKASPYHWHVGEEELLLVLEGEPTLRMPGAEERLRPWDLALFRRGEAGAHQLRNDTGFPRSRRVLLFPLRPGSRDLSGRGEGRRDRRLEP
jgi:uncharacterized cupin superfamily protein